MKVHMTAPKCPILVYLIWNSGRHCAIWLDCKRWKCAKCGQEKLQQIAVHIADSTVNRESLYHATVPDASSDAVRRALQRKKLPSLRIRFDDASIYVLTDAPLSGRNWELEECPKGEALTNILDIDNAFVLRRDYTLHWRPEQKFENVRDKAIYRLHVSNLNDLTALLGKVGQDLREEILLNPMEVATALGKLRKSNHEDTL